MKLNIRKIKEKDCSCDVLILPLFEGDKADFYRDINSLSGGLIEKTLNSGEFKAKSESLLLIHMPDKIKPKRILLTGLGKKNKITRERVRKTGGIASSYLNKMGFNKIALSTRTIETGDISPADFLEGSLLSVYSFEKYKKVEKKNGIKDFTIISNKIKKLDREIRWAEIVTSATIFSRNLVNTPSNEMTPTVLSNIAKGLKNNKISIKVLEKKDAEKAGMWAYLSVAKGSNEPPKFIILEYKGSKAQPVVLIGKSITFDSGGISLKPSEGMEKMKYDMAGGAVVLGVFKALSTLDLPLHVISILPATENLPGGSASKPGDIVMSITGKTIEILNTDAEGRLVLADAIGYAKKKYKPASIIDIATLTGACSVALGNEAIAMMGNDDKLIENINTASEETFERVWRMPLYHEYKEYLKSDIADLKNIGGRSGGLVTAGYFLYEFSDNTPWVHLDIASTAWVDKDKPYIPKGASGIGVRLLLSFLKSLSK